MKLIFIDVDGTLYSGKIKGVPDSAKKAIKQARKNGHKVIVCTGRTKKACLQSIDFEVDGYIATCGSHVEYHGKDLYDDPFTKDEVECFQQLARKYTVGYVMDGTNGTYCDRFGYLSHYKYLIGGRMNEEGQARLAKRGCFKEEAYQDDVIYKFGLYFFGDQFYKMFKERMMDGFDLNINAGIAKKLIYYVELTKEKNTKESGVCKIVEYVGLSNEDTIAIGDSMNDIGMIEHCNIGIAMGNGVEAVKEKADFVTKDILEDGIEYAFKKYGLI